MKAREEVARFIEAQMECTGKVMWEAKNCRHHYGWMELRELMDFVYGGPPQKDGERLRNPDPEKW